MKLVIYTLTVCSILGCSSVSQGPAYQPAAEREGLAIVYFYRPSAFVASIRELDIFIDDEAKHLLSNGTYAVEYLPPGKYSFAAQFAPSWGKVDGNHHELTYKVEAGESYYFGYYKALSMIKNMPEKDVIARSDKSGSSLPGGFAGDWNEAFIIASEKLASPDLQKSKLTTLVQEK